VNGEVVPGTIERRGLRTSFVIADEEGRLRVRTSEPLPDAFRNRSEVVARGHYDGESFAASEVLAKCPSKFKAA
jgi:cytochrome c-type biogenesis protein CcmE